ncbi:hypothetical protein DFH09DRAFT_1361443 [Mycena vulgaris]|nr:hypothetical protein DFH09DRAFT_1361443 [Mycena vulgaris]
MLEGRDLRDVRDRFHRSGPVPRSLFSDPTPPTDSSLDSVVNAVLAANLFAFATTAQVSDRVFLVQPLEVFDEGGRASLLRAEGALHFLSAFVADRTAALMERHVDAEEAQRQVAQALESAHTRPAARKLVESMLHRALVHSKIPLPPSLGGVPVAGELALVGNAESFALGPHTKAQRTRGPLYLRPRVFCPRSPNSDFAFAAVDAVLVTADALYLFHSAASEPHAHVRAVKTLLQIISRLESNKLAVDHLKLVYCLVGTDEARVKKRVREAGGELPVAALQASAAPRELGTLSEVARKRLQRLEVVGCTVDARRGLVLV